MIIRTAANKHEVDLAVDIFWANEQPSNPAFRDVVLRHWLHLFDTNPEGFWIAQDESTGQLIGIASATRRPPQWMLTNFFVLPSYHGQGVGKALLAHAYATHEGCDRSLVHASSHHSAQTLYMQCGMYPLPHSLIFKGNPQNLAVLPLPLRVEKCSVADILSTLNTLDQAVLGFTRSIDHEWWDQRGSYFLLRADGQTVGYFRVSIDEIIGPLVVAEPRWMTAAVNRAILEQQKISEAEHEIFIPGANRDALAYVLEHQYRIAEINFLFSSHPMPGLAQVICHDTDLL